MMKYTSTINKDAIRKWDKNLIKKDFAKKGRKLTYLGMPSGEMRDVLEWIDYISNCTAVEFTEEQIHNMALTVNKMNLEDKVTILHGDIDEILMKGKDKFGNKLCYPYDIVFLDYFGGIIYNKFKRLEAIKNLLKNQKNDFLSFLTYNMESSKYLKKMKTPILREIYKEVLGWNLDKEKIKPELEKLLDWYKKNDKDIFFERMIVPYIINKSSSLFGYKVFCYQPIFYRGFENAPMIHFAFKMSYSGALVPPFSEQSIYDIINIRMKICEDGKIKNSKIEWYTIKI